jgi:hypothetical protein
LLLNTIFHIFSQSPIAGKVTRTRSGSGGRGEDDTLGIAASKHAIVADSDLSFETPTKAAGEQRSGSAKTRRQSQSAAIASSASASAAAAAEESTPARASARRSIGASMMSLSEPPLTQSQSKSQSQVCAGRSKNYTHTNTCEYVSCHSLSKHHTLLLTFFNASNYVCNR